MKRVIILTTDIDITIAKDISKENDVLLLAPEPSIGDVSLSAVSLLMEAPARESMRRVLEYIYSAMTKYLDGYVAWLVLGNSALQPDNRVVRYRGLWGGLKSRGLEIYGADNSYEKLFEEEGGVRFFGAQRLSKASLQSVSELIFEESRAYVLLVPESFEAQKKLVRPFGGDLNGDVSVFSEVLRVGGLLKRVGCFDDRKNGFVLIAEASVVASLITI